MVNKIKLMVNNSKRIAHFFGKRVVRVIATASARK
jgi:hypothetical protein